MHLKITKDHFLLIICLGVFFACCCLAFFPIRFYLNIFFFFFPQSMTTLTRVSDQIPSAVYLWQAGALKWSHKNSCTVQQSDNRWGSLCYANFHLSWAWLLENAIVKNCKNLFICDSFSKPEKNDIGSGAFPYSYTSWLFSAAEIFAITSVKTNGGKNPTTKSQKTTTTTKTTRRKSQQ